MNQLRLLLLDVLRVLASRKLFWFALAISILVATVFASISFHATGVSLFFGGLNFDNDYLREGAPFIDLLYGKIFSHFFVGLWLTSGAIVLALISTSSILPDFLTEGTSALTVARPVSRRKIYFALSLGAVIFTAVQAFLFCGIAFGAILVRTGQANFSVFWPVALVPFIVLVLQSFGNWMALKSRSGLVALLFAMMLWIVCKIVSSAESFTYHLAYGENVALEQLVTSDEQKTKAAAIHKGIKTVHMILPKTSEINTLMKQWIVVGAEGENEGEGLLAKALGFGVDEETELETRLAAKRLSPAQILGSSALFATVFLLLGVRKFSKTDL